MLKWKTGKAGFNESKKQLAQNKFRRSKKTLVLDKNIKVSESSNDELSPIKKGSTISSFFKKATMFGNQLKTLAKKPVEVQSSSSSLKSDSSLDDIPINLPKQS